MIVRPVKTRVLQPPKDDLLAAIKRSIKRIPEKSVVIVTSKVISIWQGRCVPMDPRFAGSDPAKQAARIREKDAVVIREADFYLPRKLVPGAWCMHTLKDNVFIPSAGIDESNAAGYYLLWPRNVKGMAKELWQWLRKIYRVKDLGVIVTDSHTIPLRRGVLGISLAHYGFAPLRDYRGKPDIFGRELKMTQTNIADGLAAAAVVLMGEGDECTPLALITDVPWIPFTSKPFRSRKPFSSFEIKTSEDLYYPLLTAMPWRKGKGGKK